MEQGAAENASALGRRVAAEVPGFPRGDRGENETIE